MIGKVIRSSAEARAMILLIMAAAGILAVRTKPVYALPDLSDVQVIIRTPYPGQALQIVENQVTYNAPTKP